jgi:hypothetical protein
MDELRLVNSKKKDGNDSRIGEESLRMISKAKLSHLRRHSELLHIAFNELKEIHILGGWPLHNKN